MNILPVEIILYLAPFLQFKELLKLSQINKRFRGVYSKYLTKEIKLNDEMSYKKENKATHIILNIYNNFINVNLEKECKLLKTIKYNISLIVGLNILDLSELVKIFYIDNVINIRIIDHTSSKIEFKFVGVNKKNFPRILKLDYNKKIINFSRSRFFNLSKKK